MTVLTAKIRHLHHRAQKHLPSKMLTRSRGGAPMKLCLRRAESFQQICSDAEWIA
jgi:hypothetical protein